MLARVCFGVLLLACSSAWSQVDTSEAETATDPTDEVQLRVPPPVSGEAYPAEFAGATEANYWRGGFTLTSAYSNNISGSGANPIGDVSYSIWPTIALDTTTSRLHLTLNYSPGFTLYQHTSAYNQVDQSLAVNAQFRLSPNISLSVQEGFQKTSNVFNQPNSLLSSPVSGSVPAPRVAVITPIADQINNGTSAQLTYQVSADGMLGAGGSFGNLYYPNPAEVPGLYNSRYAGGSVFYSHRLGDKYYIGGTYQYQDLLAYQALGRNTQTSTQVQTGFAFLSIYLKPTLSLSISAGPQRYSATQTLLPTSHSWTPMTMASLGWQGERTTLALSFARLVTGGGGLNGAYQSNSVSALATRQLSRAWTAGVSASYADYSTLTPWFVLSSSGGSTVSGTVSVLRSLTDHLSLQFGYNWMRQNYGDTAMYILPNTNRVFIAISYQFTKSLQR